MSLANLNKWLHEKGILTATERVHRHHYSHSYYVSGCNVLDIDVDSVDEMSYYGWAETINDHRGMGFDRPIHVPVESRTARDTQKRKMYESEWAVEKTWKADFNARRHALTTSWLDCVEFFNKVVSEVACLRNSKITINKIRGKRRCYFQKYKNGIFIQEWGQTRITILHELAHAITDAVHGKDTKVAAHGPEFCAILLDLVQRYCGFQCRHQFHEKMIAHGCRSISLKSKPVVFVKKIENDEPEIQLFGNIADKQDVAASEAQPAGDAK